MSDRGGRLVPLSEAPEYAVGDGLPDVRGWEVRGADGESVGSVRELIVDREAARVRYVEIELAEPFAARSGHRVLVPVGLAAIAPDEDVLTVVTVTSGTARELHAYDGQVVTRALEVEVQRSVLGASELPADLAPGDEGVDAGAAAGEDAGAGGEARATADDDSFYDHEHFDERRLVAGRREGEGRRDFSYLLGVGGAMTDRDVNPEVIGEVRAGQVSIPVVQEETRRSIAPEQ